jgi:hypothetical protein
MGAPRNSDQACVGRLQAAREAKEMIAIEFISLASRLAASGPVEYRSATSREYYGAYLTARRFVEHEVGVACRHVTLGDHEMLQRLMINCGVDEANEVGRLLMCFTKRGRMPTTKWTNLIVKIEVRPR